MRPRPLISFIILLAVLNGCKKEPIIEPTPPSPLPVALSGLQPAEVFGFFEEICAIPRQSGNTKAVSDYIVEFAKDHKLDFFQDEANNVVIYAPASKGYEKLPSIALQVHLDMVCVSTDPARNPAKIGVRPKTDGEFIWAEGTSLGADNGIGVSKALAILTNLDKLPHPSLEVVFTVDEEIGMVGAEILDMSVIKSRRMINIDCEDGNACIVSSAASRRMISTLPVKREAAEGFTGIDITLSGLRGGHSGVDIHKNRSNAIFLISHLLQPLLNKCDLRIVDLNGGYAINAIATGCQVSIAFPQAQSEIVQTMLEDSCKELLNRLKNDEPGLIIDYSRQDVTNCLIASDSRSIVDALSSLPNGCIQMSEIMKDQAAVSLNTGIVELENELFSISTMIRSNKEGSIEQLFYQINNIISHYNGECKVLLDCPLWEYRAVSPLRELYLNSFLNVAGFKPAAEPCHAGLECAIFVNRIPDMEIISIGSTVYDVHTVHEKIDVQSVSRVYSAICHLLKNL